MHLGYKFLLSLFRGVLYAKRGALWAWRRAATVGRVVESAFHNTVGFRMYKFFFFARRNLLRRVPLLSGGGIVELLGGRGALQAILFLVAFALMIPHTRLSAVDSASFPGRRTILYALAGPGEEQFAIEEIIIEDVIPSDTVPSWNSGAVAQDTIGVPDAGAAQEISGISSGGTALTKPTILPGNTPPAASGVFRTKIVIHEVAPGDVIGAIAARYGVGVNTVLSANNLTLRSRIHPGDKLKILPVDGVAHTVRRGDTVQKIARLYGAKEGEIISFNKLRSDGSDIAVGEQLIVPGGTPPRPVAPAPVRRFTALQNVAAPPPSVEAPAGSGYVWPAGVRRITQYFNWRHNGIDIAGPVGTPIYAARGGVVAKSQCGWNGGYGCYIVLDHGDGFRSVYGHNSRLFVAVGDVVNQGQTIAAMGSTGNSTGPHVHFEVRFNNKNQNPLRYVR